MSAAINIASKPSAFVCQGSERTELFSSGPVDSLVGIHFTKVRSSCISSSEPHKEDQTRQDRTRESVRVFVRQGEGGRRHFCQSTTSRLNMVSNQSAALDNRSISNNNRPTELDGRSICADSLLTLPMKTTNLEEHSAHATRAEQRRNTAAACTVIAAGGTRLYEKNRI